MKLAALGLVTLAWTLADAFGNSEINPLAGYGILGVVIAFILWLHIDERKEKRALLNKLIDDVLPAITASTEQMAENASAMRDATATIDKLAARPSIDPHDLGRWQRTMDRVEQRLDSM